MKTIRMAFDLSSTDKLRLYLKKQTAADEDRHSEQIKK